MREMIMRLINCGIPRETAVAVCRIIRRAGDIKSRQTEGGKTMGMYKIIVSRGRFINTVEEWHTCREEAVARAHEYCDWLGCDDWKVIKVM